MRLEWSDDAGDHRLAASDLAVKLESPADERDLQIRPTTRPPTAPFAQAIRGNVEMQVMASFGAPWSGVARAGAPRLPVSRCGRRGTSRSGAADLRARLHDRLAAQRRPAAPARLRGRARAAAARHAPGGGDARRAVVVPLVWALGVVARTRRSPPHRPHPARHRRRGLVHRPIAVAAWHSRTRRHALGVGLVALGILALVARFAPVGASPTPPCGRSTSSARHSPAPGRPCRRSSPSSARSARPGRRRDWRPPAGPHPRVRLPRDRRGLPYLASSCSLCNG